MGEHNKFGTVTAVYNDATFIKHALESVEPIADEMFIVEGSWFPSKPARSTDGTLDLIYEFQAKHPNKVKILHYEANREIDGTIYTDETPIKSRLFYPRNAIEARNLGVRQLTSDWYFMVDSDEVYKYEDLVRLELNTRIPRDNGMPYVLGIKANVFYFDYDFCTSEYFYRLSRIVDGVSPILRDEHIVEHGPSIFINLPEELITMYHYSYSNKQKVQTKMLLYDENITTDWYNYIYLPTLDNKSHNENINYHLFAGHSGTWNRKFERFLGEHPESIKRLIESEKSKNAQ